MTVEAISKETTLEKRQVYDGVRHLRNRGLVTFSQKLTEAEYKVPPHKTIFIEMKEKSIKRIRELIK